MDAVVNAAGHILAPDPVRPAHDVHVAELAPHDGPSWLRWLLMTLVVLHVSSELIESCCRLLR